MIVSDTHGDIMSWGWCYGSMFYRRGRGRKAWPCVRVCLVLLRQCGELSSRGLSWSLYHEALVSIPPDFANREILKRQPNSLIEINNTDNTYKK